jgi:zinc transport system permease protein
LQLEIFAYSFMKNAFMVGAVVGIICPVIGLFIVLRRLSLVADALSHICLSGVAAALLAGTHPVLTASAFAVGGSILIERLRVAYKDYAELSIAVILSGGIALAAVLIGFAGGFNANFMGYLFGSLVVLNPLDVWIITGIGIFVLLLVIIFYKELFYATFDDEAAEVSGVPVKALGMGFMILTALTIAVAMKTVGILLVSSLMILPVAASLRLAVSFRSALGLAVLFSELSVNLGLFLSFYFDLPPGGTIILTSIAVLGMVMLVNKKDNLRMAE